LEKALAVEGRLKRIAMPNGWTLIDDSYNANPSSMHAAIDTLALAEGERWLVLGDMAELGVDARALHAGMGSMRASAVSKAVCRGSAECGSRRGIWRGWHALRRQGGADRCATAQVHAGVTCLVKGSHSAGMEQVVAALKSGQDTKEGGLPMLLELSDWMARHFTALHLFQYITFRTIMAALTALAMSLLCGPALIRKLAALKAGQVVRKDGPQSHLVKAGTPTMGGVMILLSVVVATLLWADLAQSLCVARAGSDALLRRDRFLRRLPQAGAQRQSRPGIALEIFLAVGVRYRRSAGSSITAAAVLPGCGDGAVRAVVQACGDTAGYFLHRHRVFHDRRVSPMR
jgi:hypothetical protein